MTTKAPPRLPYTVKEVAKMYGCSVQHIRDEIHAGRLKGRHKKDGTRFWYITDEALKDWTENYLE